MWDVDQSPPGALGMEPGVSLCQARPPRSCADSPALRPERGHVLQPPSPFMVAEPLFGLHRPVKPHTGRGGVGGCCRGVLLTQGCFQSRSKQVLAESLTGPLCFCFETCSGGQPSRPHSSHRPRGRGGGPRVFLPLFWGPPSPLGLLAQWGPSNPI